MVYQAHYFLFQTSIFAKFLIQRKLFLRFLECTLILERLKNDCASEIDKDLQELPQLKDSEGKSMTASNLSGQSA